MKALEKRLADVIYCEFPSGTSRQTRRITKVHWRRNGQRGSEGDKGSRAGPRVDLPLQRYLLLPHKRAASARKSESAPSPRRRRLPSILHDHSVIHEYYLRRGKPFLSPPPPPPRPPAPHRPRALATFRGSRLPPPTSVSAFYLLNQERCSPSIANRLGRRTFITRWLQVGAAQTWETRERAGEETSRPTTPALEKLVQTMGELIRISTAYLIMFQLIFSVFEQMIYLERGFIKARRTDLFVNLHNIFFFFFLKMMLTFYKDSSK